MTLEHRGWHRDGWRYDGSRVGLAVDHQTRAGVGGQAGVDVVGDQVAPRGVHRELRAGRGTLDIRGFPHDLTHGDDSAICQHTDGLAADACQIGGGGSDGETGGTGSAGRGIYIRKVDCLEKCGFQTASLW